MSLKQKTYFLWTINCTQSEIYFNDEASLDIQVQKAGWQKGKKTENRE